MKKILFVMMFAVMTATSAQAQLFFGASLGVDYTASSTTQGSTTETGRAFTYLDVNPVVGFYLSDEFAVGVRANFGMGSSNNRREKPNDRLNSSSQWGVSPFARLSLGTADRFSFILEGGASFSGMSTEETRGATTEKGPSTSQFGVYVLPVLTYELTDHFGLEARLNLLRLGFAMTTVTTLGSGSGSGSDETKESTTGFSFGSNSSDIVRRLNSGLGDGFVFSSSIALPMLEIGFVFKF